MTPESPRRIAVISGKGGAGKTTIACGLARALAATGRPVVLIDADAEAPDVGATLAVRWQEPAAVTQEVPAVDAGRCTGCGACAAACRFNALAMAGGRPLLFPDLCHGCGACALACARQGGAITAAGHAIGSVRRGRLPWGSVIEARTAIGSARASRVIGAAMEQADGGGDGIQVIDGPPGTGCSAVAALAGCGLAVLVVESTPFGRHDAGLAAELLHRRGIPGRVVLNRTTDDDREESLAWCGSRELGVLGMLSEDPDLARAGALGLDPWQTSPVFVRSCQDLARAITAPSAAGRRPLTAAEASAC